MNITIRADSSTQIGTGHVMRCLTLANALKEQGAHCQFICREHDGHIIEHIERQGFTVHRLANNPDASTIINKSMPTVLAHAAWLGVSQEQDAQECIALLQKQQMDWLVVDHYALDKRWHSQLRPHTQKIMVIDDLADREHDCDLLLDQNLGRKEKDYTALTPSHCQFFIGPNYALLRPEFAQWRETSLKRRQAGELNKVLISLGGVDKDNVTGQLLKALQQANIPRDIEFTVILGAANPHLEQVKESAASLSNPTAVLVGVNNMAELMANNDLAIGAAGVTSWERCCLGLPSIVLVLAENQRNGAQALAQTGCAFLAENVAQVSEQLSRLLNDGNQLFYIAQNSANLVNGLGVKAVSFKLMNAPTLFSLRPMHADDLDIVRAWRNHPDVRRYMFHQNEIQAEEHQQWFNKKNQDTQVQLLIFEKNKHPLGFLQLSLQSKDSIEWGFYLAPNAQGGLGVIFGKQAVDYCFYTLKTKRIYGEVLLDNIRSQRFHEKLGFIKQPLRSSQQNFYSYQLTLENYEKGRR